MKSILYPKGNIPKPFYLNNSDDDSTIILISLILVVAFFVFIFFKLGSNRLDLVYYPCPIGECATSLTTGNKRCPTNLQEFIYFDPSQEVCNPAPACTNPQTPYAVQNNGTVDINGICQNNSMCRCVNKISCPNYSTVIFTVGNGLYEQTSGGNVLTGGFEFVPLENQTCIIDPTSVSKLGCTGTVEQCLQKNPCVQGVLTIIPPDGVSPTDFNQYANKFSFPLTCMPGKVCTKGINIYNYSTGKSDCVES